MARRGSPALARNRRARPTPSRRTTVMAEGGTPASGRASTPSLGASPEHGRYVVRNAARVVIRRPDERDGTGTSRRVFAVLPGLTRITAVALLTTVVAALWLVPASVSGRPQQIGSRDLDLAAAQEQVLLWTADNRIDTYASAPATAVAGTATIVFETSTATGNTFNMAHTLTFDTTTPGYNHDVDVDIVASPFDTHGGRHEAPVTLSPGTYRYFCAMPGHRLMVGELVVTESGDGGDTTPPEVSAEVSGERDADGNYVGVATVALSARDQSGVESIEFELDGAGFAEYTQPVPVSTAGEHTVRYRASDPAGNVSELGSVSFTVVEPPPGDTAPPEVPAEVSGERAAGGTT